MKWSMTKDKLNHFLNDYYRPLSIAMAVVVLVLGALSLLWPQYTQLKTKGILEHEEAERILIERQNYLTNIKQMKVQYDQLNFRAWQSLNYILPKEEDTYLLFAQLESFAKENNLVITSININDDSGESSAGVPNAAADQAATAVANAANPISMLPDNIKQVDININISGVSSYADFKKFMVTIENNLRLMDTNKINYQPDKTGYTLSYNTYYLKKETVSATATVNGAAADGTTPIDESYVPTEE